MITSQEYLRHSDLQRDFLTAFSALDHSVTETMGTGQVQACFELLVSRLAAICALHGPGTARNFLQAVASAYLEIGHPPAHDMERAMVERRELQQEILHFSRIVALPELQGGAIPQNKRLRNSKLIPEQVKVVCEFLTVARGRILQRGKAVPTPRARPDQQGNTPWGSGRLLVHDRELSDYVLVIACDQASVQKDLAFLWASLLTYLTPRESLSALCLHLLEGHPACGLVGFTLLEPGAGDRLRVTHCRPAPLGGGEGAGRLQQAVANLPEELEVPAGEGWISFSGPDPVEARLTAAQDRGRRLLELRTPDPAVPAFRIGLAHAGHFARSREETVAEALHLFRNRHEARVQVASIESAHIHLDRQIDEDQILGSAIGHALHGHLATVQAQPPRLNPMVDDDHALPIGSRGPT